MTISPQAPNYAVVKSRQQQTWATGDYQMIASCIVPVSELLCEAVELQAGERVLDVATGSGNTALAAARRFSDVTGVDYVPGLLERGRLRASAEGLPVTFREGDAEALPVDDATFDVVVSTFGSMFSPDQEQAAAELLRACRPGGRIGMTNWTPDGWIGQMFRVVGRHVPPPVGLRPPTRWGTEEGVRELFGSGVTSLQARRKAFVWRFATPQHYLDLFRTFYGPTNRAFAALDAAGQDALGRDLIELVTQFNVAQSGPLLVPADYLEVVAVKA